MTTDHVLVDTNIIVFQLGGNEKAERILQDIKGHVSFVTEIELLGHPGSTERERTTIREALAQMRIADINR